MEISLLQTDDGFASLRTEWDALLAAACRSSVFQSWEYQYNWWKNYGQDQSLRLVVARDGDELVAVVPLYLQALPALGLTASVLRLVGTGADTSPDDLDPLVRCGRADDAADALARFIVDQAGWDVLRLSDVRADSPLRRAVDAVCTERGLAVQRGVSAVIPFLPLPATWDEYLASLHRDRRYQVRSQRRKLEKVLGYRFFAWQDGSRIEAAVDRLVELHRLRWSGRSARYAFSSPEYVTLHREMIRASHARGWLRLYCLAAGETVIAMLYCFRFGNQVFYFQGGFDPQHEELRPGHVLMGHAIEHAIGEGNAVFDMLRGDYSHKALWAKEKRETSLFESYRPTLGGLAYRARTAWLPAGKAAVRKALGRFGVRLESATP